MYGDLTRSYKNFAEQYNKWHEKISDSLSHSNHVAINNQYRKLITAATTKTQPKSIKRFKADYNKYVDDLLKLAPQKRTYPVCSLYDCIRIYQ